MEDARTHPTRAMRVRTRVLRSVATLTAFGTLAALSALGTPVSVSASASPGSARGPAGERGDSWYGAPDADACYDVPLAAADLDALRDDTVPCTKRHTLWIVGVARAPRSVEFDGSIKFWRFVVRACSTAQNEAIGDHMHRYLRTVYQNFFFLPTKAQQRHGARWISCELGWLVGNERLVKTRTTTPPPLRPRMPDEVSLCMDRYRIQCSQPHRWRAVYGTAVRGQATDASVRRAAHRVCPGHTATRRWSYSGGEPMGVSSFSLVCYNRAEGGPGR